MPHISALLVCKSLLNCHFYSGPCNAMQKQDTVQTLMKSFPLYLSSVIFEWCIISDCKPRLASIWKNSPTSQANLHNGPLENLTLSFGQRVEIEHSSFCLCSGVVVVKGLAIDGLPPLKTEEQCDSLTDMLFRMTLKTWGQELES